MDRAESGAISYFRNSAGCAVSLDSERTSSTDRAMEPNLSPQRRRSNRRLGLFLGAVALAFFFAVIAKKILIG